MENAERDPVCVDVELEHKINAIREQVQVDIMDARAEEQEQVQI